MYHVLDNKVCGYCCLMSYFFRYIQERVIGYFLLLLLLTVCSNLFTCCIGSIDIYHPADEALGNSGIHNM